MGFAEVGVSALGSNKRIVMFVSCALSFISCIFFLIGAIGGVDDYDVITNVPWIKGYATYEDTEKNNFVVGLTSYGCELCSDKLKEGTIKFDDKSCNTDSCDLCLDAGNAAIGLCSVALILCIAVIVVSFLRIGADTIIMKTIASACSLIPAIFGIAAVANWDTTCFAEYEDSGLKDVEHGVGWVLTLIAFLLMILVAIAQPLVPCSSAGVAPS